MIRPHAWFTPISLLLTPLLIVRGALLATPLARLHAANPAQPSSPRADDPPVDKAAAAPPDNTKLSPGTVERLQWGDPVNGLRAALVRPQALGKPEKGEVFDLHFVVQNMSELPIRFCTSTAATNMTHLKVRKRGVTLAAFHNSKPLRTDALLQPRSVAVLRMFPDHIAGASITADSPDLTFSAELTIENAPAGVWTGKLVAAEMHAALAGYGLLPQHKDAQTLFKVWNVSARGDGKIPGALIGQLAGGVTTFTKDNPTWETTPQLLKLLPRLDASRDWNGLDALSLLDELAAIQGSPIKLVLDKELERTIQTGTPLPPELAGAPWGEALPNGLRMAWLLEPSAAEHPLGTPLKSRILFHNTGTAPVVFRSRTWHQGGHQATDARGAAIKVDSVSWTAIGRLVPFRLAPGEFVEVSAAGIGVGANKPASDGQNTRVGSWIEAKAGDEVTVTTGPLPIGDWNENPQPGDETRWWLDFVTASLARHRPLPADAAERKRLLNRVALELFGTSLKAEEIAAFVVDQEPTALSSLAQRLARRAGLTPSAGSLVSGPTKFRVLPARP